MPEFFEIHGIFRLLEFTIVDPMASFSAIRQKMMAGVHPGELAVFRTRRIPGLFIT